MIEREPFEPVTVPRHQRRLEGLSGNVNSLYAKGLTTGEIQAHLAGSNDTDVSREKISEITDKLSERRHQPLAATQRQDSEIDWTVSARLSSLET